MSAEEAPGSAIRSHCRQLLNQKIARLGKGEAGRALTGWRCEGALEVRWSGVGYRKMEGPFVPPFVPQGKHGKKLAALQSSGRFSSTEWNDALRRRYLYFAASSRS